MAGACRRWCSSPGESTRSTWAILPPEQAATLVAQGAGAYGAALDYLRNVVRHLDEFGIDDCPLHRVLTLAEAKAASARGGSRRMTEDRAVVHSGGCQCGAVRYALFADPERAHICHCRMCQKAVGGPFAALAPVRLADFAWTRGAPGAFLSSSVAARDYCAGCGTPLTFRYLDSEWIDVTIGSLDRPRDVPPGEQFGIESRMPWFDHLAALPATTTSESMERHRQARLVNHQHPDRYRYAARLAAPASSVGDSRVRRLGVIRPVGRSDMSHRRGLRERRRMIMCMIMTRNAAMRSQRMTVLLTPEAKSTDRGAGADARHYLQRAGAAGDRGL